MKISGQRLLCGSLLAALLFLSACAVRQPQPVASEPVASAQEPAEAQVAPVEPEVRGFVIDEPHQLSEAEHSTFHQAVALLEQGQLEAAVELLEALVEAEPLLSAPYINLAKAYRQLGEKEKAEAALQKALQLIPGHPIASQEYGLLLREAGRFDEARSLAEQSLALFPDYLPLRKNLGILCDIYLNDPVCALEQFEYIQNLQPDDEIKLWISEIKLR